MYTALLVIVTIIWGSTFFVIKNTVAVTNEYLIVFGRTFLASIVMFLFLWLKHKRAILNIHSIFRGFVLGFLMALIYCSQTIGLKFTSSGHSAFVTGTAVVMVPILLFFLEKQKVSIKTIMQVFIVFGGLFLLTYDFETKINIGDLITIITAIALALHTIYAGKFVRRGDVFGLVAYQFLFASLFSAAGFFITGNSLELPDKNGILAILYLGIVGTLICYFITIWVQKFVSSTKVALTFSLEPVFAAFFGYWALNETLSFKELLGALLIIIGIIGYQAIRSFKKINYKVQ